MDTSATDLIAAGLLKGDRGALSRAITLVESDNPGHRVDACNLLRQLTARGLGQGIRIGITGAPGAGKSTFIDSLGSLLVGRGHKLAVLAVDPTSSFGGGSILGDKTRMPNLARTQNAYIRPSPSGRNTQGIGNRTGEAALLCEQAGYDIVIIETTGVGQTDFQVSEVTDVFVLLVTPHGGDEMQGIKRGITEHADVVIVTKCDGELANVARRTCMEYASALQLLRPRTGEPDTRPKALTVSSLDQHSVGEAWEQISQIADRRHDSGALMKNRQQQIVREFHNELQRQLHERINSDTGLAARMAELEGNMVNYTVSSPEAARDILGRLCEPTQKFKD